MMQTPPPPSITPRQMNLLRVVSSMAWSDGELAIEEVDVMLDRFSRLFATDSNAQQQLQQELRDYMMQNIPLKELTAKLQTPEEKELVLRIGYEVICSSARTPDEEAINDDEAEAYHQLVELLGLPDDTVQRVLSEAEASIAQSGNLVDHLTQQVEQFLR